jgi:hypothetical protein
MAIQGYNRSKSDILNEIKYNKSVLRWGCCHIKVKKEITLNKYENQALLSEIKILFQEIANISISNHTLNENTDSLDGTCTIILQ